MSEQPITAALITELRKRTGVGVGKCKQALEVAKGDIEVAIADLRKAGIASAVKKEGRETNEGMVGSYADAKAVGVVEVAAESDFVVRNDRFQDFVAQLSKLAAETQPQSLEQFLEQKYKNDEELTVDQFRSTLVQTLGENIQVKRVISFAKGNGRSVGLYSHLGGKVVTAVAIDGSDAEEQIAKDIAMHIAAAAPEYLSVESVPASVLENERDIAATQAAGKPEPIVEKIVAGKIQSFYDANCLLRQPYLRDDSMTISELVKKRSTEVGQPLNVVSFIRWGMSV